MKECTTASGGADTGVGSGWGRIGSAALFGSVFTLPVSVDAGVVYSGLQNLAVTLAPGDRVASIATAPAMRMATLKLDLDGNLVDDFEVTLRQDQFGVGGGFGQGRVWIDGIAGGNGFALAEGGFPVRGHSSNIGASVADWRGGKLLHSVFAGGGTYGFGAGSPFILGMRFRDGADTHYGWIRLLIEHGTGGFPVSVKAVDWAWNDVAGALTHIVDITPVPEANPALALLAAGGTGLAAWRLRRRQGSTGSSETAGN